jgi:glutaredoxin 3
MEYINTHLVQVFSKSSCPYCQNTIQLIEQYCIDDRCDPCDVEITEMNFQPNGEDMKEVLTRYTNQTTVPYIFLYGKFIGGYSDLVYLHLSNQLRDVFVKKRIEYMTKDIGSPSKNNRTKEDICLEKSIFIR